MSPQTKLISLPFSLQMLPTVSNASWVPIGLWLHNVVVISSASILEHSAPHFPRELRFATYLPHGTWRGVARPADTCASSVIGFVNTCLLKLQYFIKRLLERGVFFLLTTINKPFSA